MENFEAFAHGILVTARNDIQRGWIQEAARTEDGVCLVEALWCPIRGDYQIQGSLEASDEIIAAGRQLLRFVDALCPVPSSVRLELVEEVAGSISVHYNDKQATQKEHVLMVLDEAIIVTSPKPDVSFLQEDLIAA